MKKEIKSWPCVESRLLQKTRVFDLYSRRLRSPQTGKEDEFYIIQARNWVNIIPITPKQEVVMVRQFRFGVEAASLEIPGGVIEDGELPREAALRELIEETGYRAKDASELGWVHTNPAVLTNRCYSYIAQDVEFAGTQNLDSLEDISVELIPLRYVPKLIYTREITHTLVIAAFHHFFTRQSEFFRRGIFEEDF